MKSSSTFQLTLRHTLAIAILVGLCSLQALAKGFPQRNPAKTITGTVTLATNNQPIAGANVLIKGTQAGTVTDQKGNYSISVNSNSAVLVFSFVGHTPQEVTVGNQSVINVALVESSEVLGEVVVTALGIKREERSLGYSVGTVAGKDMTHVVQENVLTSMAGKVSGVQISQTGGAGSSVSMIIRGAKSLSTDNQPLFVVDGVPIVNSLSNVQQVAGNSNTVDYGNAISDINPEDVESVSILKGPSAAALYGTRAGNGVVLITTKSGAKNKRMTVSITSNTVFDNPYKFLPMETKYAVGNLPYLPNSQGVIVDQSGNPYTIDESQSQWAGPELDKGYKAIQWNSPKDANGKRIPTPLVSHPDNVKNFVRTGVTTTNGISIANSTDRVDYRLSYSNMTNHGIIPNSDLFKNSVAINSTVKASDKLRISTSLDVSQQRSNNRPSSGPGTNPLQAAYDVGPNNDIRDLRNYWVPGQEGLQQLSVSQGNYNNPWFMAYEVNNGFTRNRAFGNLKADWQITPELSVMGMYALDIYNERRETKITNSYTKETHGGAYGLADIDQLERNMSFLATYKKDLKDFHFTVSAGANNRYSMNSNITNSSKSGSGLIIPNLFTLSNIAPTNLNYSSYYQQRGIQSVYGLANIGFKDKIYLDITARNDWSSTLPKGNNSYFYPSASLSVLLNEFVNVKNVNLFKLRAGVAQVGNDAAAYSLYNTLTNAGAWGGSLIRLGKNNQILLPTLKPEISTSYEGGIDLNMFQNRLRFTGTYYNQENRNQILPSTIVGSSGYSTKNINAGLLVSRGLELSLGGTPIDKNGFRWDIMFNFSRNRTIIKELAPGIDKFTFWTAGKGGAWTFVGETVGDMYDAQLQTVTDKTSPYYGYPILTSDGQWSSVGATSTKNKIGNYNPDFTLGTQTSLSYKGFTLNMNFDWRAGGSFLSQTYRYYESDFHSQRYVESIINPGGRTGDALVSWLKANADQYIIPHGNQFPQVGGPTADAGGFSWAGDNGTSNGNFIPGVMAQYDSKGNITGYTENLGGPGTTYFGYNDGYAWSFNKAAQFDASFVKLREISLSYDIPRSFLKGLKVQNASLGVYSRNIILWTAAKINIDPEMAFQPQTTPGTTGTFMQGVERYNVTPWVIPVGFKLNVTF
ncbi:SusC/RagA family TonB-linked outer membrane protein [Spirosoma litoris]